MDFSCCYPFSQDLFRPGHQQECVSDLQSREQVPEQPLRALVGFLSHQNLIRPSRHHFYPQICKSMLQRKYITRVNTKRGIYGGLTQVEMMMYMEVDDCCPSEQLVEKMIREENHGRQKRSSDFWSKTREEKNKNKKPWEVKINAKPNQTNQPVQVSSCDRTCI